VNDAPALVSQNEKHLQNLKPDCRDREEVYRYQTLNMILKKSSPGLRGRLARANKVFAHNALADVYAEFRQFTLNARRTILDSHGSCGEFGRACPARPPDALPSLRIFHVQNTRTAVRCHAITVSGFTISSEDRQSRQTRENQIQTRRSDDFNRGRFTER
jgi:hypothetical protein